MTKKPKSAVLTKKPKSAVMTKKPKAVVETKKHGGDDFNITKYGGMLKYRYFWYFVMLLIL